MRLAIIALALGSALMTAAQAQPQQPTHSTQDGVYAPDQAERGRALYEAQCALCHGAGLEGAEIAPALSGGAFAGNWHGQSVYALADRIQNTMPLEDPGSLSPAQTADIIAFILAGNRFPAGAEPLPSETTAQRAIRIGPNS